MESKVYLILKSILAIQYNPLNQEITVAKIALKVNSLQEQQ